MTLADRFERVQEHLIGLWRFHELNQPVRWCSTYNWKGCYRDTAPKKTPDEALDAVHRALQQLRKN